MIVLVSALRLIELLVDETNDEQSKALSDLKETSNKMNRFFQRTTITVDTLDDKILSLVRYWEGIAMKAQKGWALNFCIYVHDIMYFLSSEIQVRTPTDEKSWFCDRYPLWDFEREDICRMFCDALYVSVVVLMVSMHFIRVATRNSISSSVAGMYALFISKSTIVLCILAFHANNFLLRTYFNMNN